jgi:hypothetical protein
MKHIKWILFVYLLASFLGCNNFYQDYQQEDLWRLPLLDPYELKTVAGAKPEDFNNNNWHLVFQKLKVDSIASGINVTMINVDKGIIYGYGTVYPSYHFLINCNTKEEKVFKQINGWQKELKNLGVNPDSVYDVWKLFEKFKDDEYLKWHS